MAIDGVRTVTFRCAVEGAPQGSTLSIILFLLSINGLLQRLGSVDIHTRWSYGSVDDTNFSTSSKSVSQNVAVLNKAAAIAVFWAAEDSNPDLTGFSVDFDGETVHPSIFVKLGLHLLLVL
ncbi:hypothetical protein B0H17DRAFT_1195304 [Mycena rosella]|uniref:Uncharacterized protein n=1 Tax=Mycena rosella TaxID=1033263 RepID=A0AAD7GQJ8_MYCRO|nr:hypothetical protein B0H17DRAFT_1195304 [Mycena rosella]